MRIAESNIAMMGNSQYSLTAKSVRTVTGSGINNFSGSLFKSTQQQKSGMISVSNNTGDARRGQTNVSAPMAVGRIGQGFGAFKEDLRITLLQRIIEMIENRSNRSGASYKTVEIPDFEERMRVLKEDLERIKNMESMSMPVQVISQSQIREITEVYESQSMSFEMSANVRTADGKEINVDIMLNMSSEFYAKTESVWSQAAMKDPLVINFNGNSSLLSNQKFEFDLDCDGEPDQISQLLGGNGFLAWDKNEDGNINDGSELFGALTGDGFMELAAHDKDGNGWIDENDDIFNSLRVWFKDDTGMDRLVTLGESGVGAIFLGNVNTTYMLKENFDDMNGMIRSTGFYLNENGTAGTIHHVDMVV